MNANQMNTGRGYWFAWVLASAIGFSMGAILGVSFAYGIFDRDPFDTIMGITMGTVMGATGGYFQWVVLRERITGAGLWGLASALGFGSAMGAIVATDSVWNYAMTGVLMASIFGVASGILQWQILRRKVPRAGWWLLANILGSLVGVIGIPATVALSESGNWDLAVMTFGLVFGAGYGAITGIALLWLLRQSPSGDVEGLATAH